MTFDIEAPEGTITVPDSVLAGVVTRAAESVDGAQVRRGRRRLEVDVSSEGARVRLELTARYGVVLPELAREVQERVAEAIRTMFRVDLATVDVSVEEVE